MRKCLFLAVIIVALLQVGFTGKLPMPIEGVYNLKLKTLTGFDLNSGEIPIYGNVAELTDSKPEFLEVEGIDYDQSSNIKFGSFRLGNNEKKTWFMMIQSSTGYWDKFYLDQNSDNKLTKKEQIKSFQTSQGNKSGYRIMFSAALIPVSIKVSYKGITKEYEKDLYFFIRTIAESKKDEVHAAAVAFSASFLEGEMKIVANKEQKLVKFTIIDADSNGCFNDYGKDVLFVNQKQDGSFHKNESQKLVEYFDSTGAEKIKKQLRLNMLPFSLQLGVTEVTGDFDLAQLEPAVDPAEKDTKSETTQKPEPDKTDQQKQDKSDSGT